MDKDKGSEIRETMGENGKVQPQCIAVSIASLTVGDRDVPLKSTTITSDCKIQTKDYGDFLLKADFAHGSASILLTSAQEKAVRKLLAVDVKK
jgi:hypothetical protein